MAKLLNTRPRWQVVQDSVETLRKIQNTDRLSATRAAALLLLLLNVMTDNRTRELVSNVRHASY